MDITRNANIWLQGWGPHCSVVEQQDIPWSELPQEPNLPSSGLLCEKKIDTLWLCLNYASFCHNQGSGTPLQHACLENPMDGGAWWAAGHGVAKSQTRLSDFTFHFHGLGEGNGNPLQYSCLENPRDGGAWWAAIYGVARSRTRLKRLSSSSSSSSRPPCPSPTPGVHSNSCPLGRWYT